MNISYPPFIEKIDYLVIGHVSKDVTPHGLQIGGTASFAARTAKALGLRVGIVTAGEFELPIPELEGIDIVLLHNGSSTIFENIQTPNGRIQYNYEVAPTLGPSLIPEIWRDTPIVHFGPIAQEVDPNMPRAFNNSFIGLTLQGWLRQVDEHKKVSLAEWPEAGYVLSKANAAVISIEDVNGNEEMIEEFVSHTRIFVVTEGEKGARVYWNGDVRWFRPSKVVVGDSVGAGDIFATSFFTRLVETNNPWEAARFATCIAENSVTREGLDGTPRLEEVARSRLEIIQD